MKKRPLVHALALSFIAASLPLRAADIVLTPPSGGGVTVTNAAGNATQLHVGDDGTTVNGNLNLVTSTATTGNIMKGSLLFLHDFGANNTFIGAGAGNLTMTGFGNAGVGTLALGVNTTGFDNTAIGSNALRNNSNGGSNTASGKSALFANTFGNGNTASGASALAANTSGSSNTAVGMGALGSSTTGDNNTATGADALAANDTGTNNTATGQGALTSNTNGIFNTANGEAALSGNTSGQSNTAVGSGALGGNTSGNNNIAVGYGAGNLLTTGDNNIDIGNSGVGGESNTIRIGSGQSTTFIAGILNILASGIAVFINPSTGQLGVIPSSRRFKDDIANMADSSSGLMKLRPVTFHYKSDRNPSGPTLQYGLIAEEVAEVYPGMVAYSADGKVETVMYQFLAPMLLNEYQKQQRRIDVQAALLSRQTDRIAELERERRSQTAEIAGLKSAVADIAELKQETARMAKVLGRLGRQELVSTVQR